MTAATRMHQDASGEVPARDPKAYLAPDIWEREVRLLVRDHSFDAATAERPFGHAVAYLIMAMETHGQRLELGRGELVDTAVHTFILDTRNYRECCHQRTAEVIEANGFQVDWQLCGSGSSMCTGAIRCKAAL